MSALRDLQIVNIYDQIRAVQEASFKKYGSYSHAAGFLGVWLEMAFYHLPRREQRVMEERLQNMIAELKQ